MDSPPEKPNIVRSRISHQMAFPVGYELLRTYFGDLAQWPGARLRFSEHPTTFASEFTRILRDSEPYCIFRIEYRPCERRGYDHILAGWSFTAFPVRRELKSSARTALCAEPFATFREFIGGIPTSSDVYTRREVVFHPGAATCTVEPPFRR